MGSARIQASRSATPADAVAVWPVYRSIFGDQSNFDAWRRDVWNRHAARAGFRVAYAYQGQELVGFAYGYTGEPGQWWTDNARTVLAPEVADAWLGGHFELVSLGVVHGARRAGIGRGLIHALLDGLDHERFLLMTTADETDPARHLYRSEGWQVIGPGIGAETVIMGTGRGRR